MIEFRAGTNTGAPASGTSIAMTIPSTCAVNDILVAFAEVDGGPAITPGSGGWTIWAQAVDGAGARAAMLWKRVFGNEPGASTTVCTWTGSQFKQGAMGAYSGVVISGDPQSGTATVANGTDTTAETTAVTTTEEDCMVIVGCVNVDVSNTHSSTFGTERQDITSIAFYDALQEAAGSTGSNTVTIGGTAPGGWSAFCVALKSGQPVVRPDYSRFPKHKLRAA